jgi:hypothetical protein
MAAKIDSDEFIENLSDAQLDLLDVRLAARRKAIGDQLVFCQKGPLGIYWSPGYGDTSDLNVCRSCHGLGYTERRVSPQSEPWAPAVALEAVVEECVSGRKWLILNVKAKNVYEIKSQYGESVQASHVAGSLADYKVKTSTGLTKTVTGSYALREALYEGLRRH